MYLTYNKDKSVVAERFIKTLRCKIYKMSYYSEPNTHITYKFKVVLDFSNDVTKKELKDATEILLLSKLKLTN